MDVINYLDDFFVVGRPGLEQCKQSLDKSLALCTKLGVPLRLRDQHRACFSSALK